MSKRNTTRTSRADVARHAGVSESTVSRALNDSSLISQAVKDRVRRSARVLGYVRNRQAEMFARNRAGSIGFVVPRYAAFPPFSRAYFPTVLDGVVVAAEQRHFFVTIILDHEDTTVESLAQLVTGRSVDGLLFTATPAEYTRYEHLQDLGVPFVLISNYHDSMYSVDARPEPGMRKAFQHVYELGHRVFGYVTGDLRYKNGQDRLGVFKRLCGEFDVAFSICEGNFSRTSGYTCAQQLLLNAPTVIMTASDRAALGVVAHCSDQGIAVPDEVSVIGYDDLHPAQDALLPLSTVRNPIEQSGYQAATLIIDMVEGIRSSPEAIWLDTDYVPRSSTGPVKSPE